GEGTCRGGGDGGARHGAGATSLAHADMAARPPHRRRPGPAAHHALGGRTPGTIDLAVTRVLASAALCPPGPPAPGWVAIDDGVIVETGWGPAPAGAVDTGPTLLSPGLIDVQVNGVDGDEFATVDAAGWRRARPAQLAHPATA